MVRPGMAIYGVYPEPKFRQARTFWICARLSALRARVVYVKKLPPAKRRLQPRLRREAATRGSRRCPSATPTAGRARRREGRASPHQATRLYPVIASVSASHTIVGNRRRSRRVQVGDVATFFDWRRDRGPRTSRGVRRFGLRPDDAPQPAAFAPRRRDHVLKGAGRGAGRCDARSRAADRMSRPSAHSTRQRSHAVQGMSAAEQPRRRRSALSGRPSAARYIDARISRVTSARDGH